MDAAQSADLAASKAADAALERQRLEKKQAEWNANWGKGLPGVGAAPGKLAAGERIVSLEEYGA